MYHRQQLEKIIDYIDFAEKFISNSIDKKKYLELLESLSSVEEIKNNKVLKEWESSLIYNLEGIDKLKAEGKKRTHTKTYLLIHPYFINYLELIEKELKSYLCEKKNIYAKKFQYTFTKELIVRLYGGTQWFEPYTKICLSNDVFFKKSICFCISSLNHKDCVLDLIDFKNLFREKYPELELKTQFDDCELPGKINPFHTPDSVENENHVKAIEKVLLGELYE